MIKETPLPNPEPYSHNTNKMQSHHSMSAIPIFLFLFDIILYYRPHIYVHMHYLVRISIVSTLSDAIWIIWKSEKKTHWILENKIYIFWIYHNCTAAILIQSAFRCSINVSIQEFVFDRNMIAINMMNTCFRPDLDIMS